MVSLSDRPDVHDQYATVTQHSGLTDLSLKMEFVSGTARYSTVSAYLKVDRSNQTFLLEEFMDGLFFLHLN